MATPKTIGSQEVHTAIARLATAIAERHRSTPRLLLLGIANGGIPLAHRLARELTKHRPAFLIRSGTLDISFHRDDIGRHPIPKEFTPTLLPTDIHHAVVILVDDVLFTGRTIKAALDELFDHGRPERVELAVLVDRPGRRLPVQADYAGLKLDARADETVVVTIDNEAPARDAIVIERPKSKIQPPKAKTS